jgi:hypothetical protein
MPTATAPAKTAASDAPAIAACARGSVRRPRVAVTHGSDSVPMPTKPHNATIAAANRQPSAVISAAGAPAAVSAGERAATATATALPGPTTTITATVLSRRPRATTNVAASPAASESQAARPNVRYSVGRSTTGSAPTSARAARDLAVAASAIASTVPIAAKRPNAFQ